MVRVSPGEVHFEDPDFIETLYPSRGKKVDKPEVIAIRAGSKPLQPLSLFYECLVD